MKLFKVNQKYIPPEVANPDKVRELLSTPLRVYGDPCSEPDRYCVIYQEVGNVSNDLWNIIVNERGYGEPVSGTWPNPTNWSADDEAVILFKRLNEKFEVLTRRAHDLCKDGYPMNRGVAITDRPPYEVFGCEQRAPTPTTPRTPGGTIPPSLLERINQLLSTPLRVYGVPCNEPDRYCVIYQDWLLNLINQEDVG
jgi:hypothetical protein